MNIDNAIGLGGTTAEQAVGRIWREVFGAAAADNAGGTFFELGGDSITAVRLIARIDDELGVAVDVGDIFEEDPDLTSLTRTVTANGAAA